MQRLQHHLKNVLYPSVIWIAGFLALPFPAHAILFLGPLAVATIVYAVLFILQYIGGMLFSFGGFLAGYFINFNLALINNPLIATGWTIVRDVANLGFVLVIIVIAFATIIRYKTYGAQKLLPKLIAAAIIVNFSLTIGNVFINFSHVLTRYFFNAVSESGSASVVPGKAIVDSLASAFDPQNLFIESAEPAPIDPEDEVGAFSQLTAGFLNQIVSVFFVVIFTFAGAFVLFIFAFMLLVRYIYLSILLIISPLVWLFWVVPALEGTFKQWWNKFLEWIFFAPAVSFFFYLTLLSVQKIDTGVAALKPEQYFKDGVIASVIAQGAKMTVLIGLLVGGMIIAQKFGISGAAFAMKTMQGAAAGAGAGLRKYAGNKWTRGLERVREGRAGQWTAEKIKAMQESKAGGAIGKGLKWVRKPTELGGLVSAEAETKKVGFMSSLLRGTAEGAGIIKPKEKRVRKSKEELAKDRKRVEANIRRRLGKKQDEKFSMEEAAKKAPELYDELLDTEEQQERIRRVEINMTVDAKFKDTETSNPSSDADGNVNREKYLDNQLTAHQNYYQELKKLKDEAKDKDKQNEYADYMANVQKLMNKLKEDWKKLGKGEWREEKGKPKMTPEQIEEAEAAGHS